MLKEDNNVVPERGVCGIVFVRSIRASLAIFSLALFDGGDDVNDESNDQEDKNDPGDDEWETNSSFEGDDDAMKVVKVIMNFPLSQQKQATLQPEQNSSESNKNERVTVVAQQSSLRSASRKCCNLGDLVVVTGGQWIHAQPGDNDTSACSSNMMSCSLCYSIYLSPGSMLETTNATTLAQPLGEYLKVRQPRRWTVYQCQQAAASWQRRRIPLVDSPNMVTSSCIPPPNNRMIWRHHRSNGGQHQPGRRRPNSPRPHHHLTSRISRTTKSVDSSCTHCGSRKSDEGKDGGSDESRRQHHVAVVTKRIQGEYLANFLIDMMAHKLRNRNHHPNGSSSPAEHKGSAVLPSCSAARRQEVVAYLNGGTGVLDVAGGSGHVSMALAIAGIQSTIVDPRSKLGKLPRRDRIFFRKRQQNANVIEDDGESWTKMDQQQHNKHSAVLAKSSNDSNIQNQENSNSKTRIDEQQDVVPIVEFKTFRAWFGIPPPGMEWHRHGECLQICSTDHELLRSCSAIVALHPDEATEAIVDVAVQLRIPFCVVPCCVFARLYPNRQLRNKHPVCNYQDLLDYLQEKDESIQRLVLPFEGANTILWSTFH